MTKIDNDGLKIKVDDLSVDQLRDLIKFVDGFINSQERLQIIAPTTTITNIPAK